MELNLRQSEEKYRTLVDLALVGIGIHQNGCYVFANKKFADMLGYTLEEIIGLPIIETVHPDERDFILARAQRRQAGGDEPVTYEVRLWKKGGGTVYALLSNAVMEYNGQPATLLTMADITDTKARKELEQANKELEAFSYSVSHDLRAPLRSIEGFSQALLEDYGDSLDETGKDYLHRVRAASQHMAQLINDLLKLSRLTRAEMRYETVNLSVEAASIVATLQETAKERQVEFIIGKDITAYGDRNLLRVVLDNLLSNAWKFTSRHPRARIEFGAIQRDGKSVYFVHDDGAGFAMASRDPYTAEHQRMVAELARLVGEKMGLDKNRLMGLYIGGLLHDIGKVSTPETILTKPGKLTDEEWILLRSHTKRGYEILKDTHLPWPVADIAVHHHERLDGSGYPHGIRADRLSLEVRILSVCDVVEAMSSHRPYRPSRSKDEVLKEIKDGRGTKYDATVVDIILQIIENEEFQLFPP